MEFEITAEQAKRKVVEYSDKVLNIFTNYFLSHIIEESEKGKSNITYGMNVPFMSQNKYSYAYSTEQDFISKLISFVETNNIIDLEYQAFREFIAQVSLATLLRKAGKQLEIRGFKVYTEEKTNSTNSFYSNFLEIDNSNDEDQNSKGKLIFAISWEDEEWVKDEEWTKDEEWINNN